MTGILMVFNASQLHRTTITTGDDGVIINYGYNSGLYGSIASGTYTDRGGNSRTIRVVVWDGANVQFWITGASIPNTDITFNNIFLVGPGGSVGLTRAAATYNGAAGGGSLSSWVWSSSAAPGTTGQSVTLVIG